MNPLNPTPAQALADLRTLLAAPLPVASERKRLLEKAIAVLIHPAEEQAKLQRELRYACEGNAKRNRQLDLLGMVWCNGGCEGGMARYEDREITATDVALLITNAERARAWYVNRAGKTAPYNEHAAAWAKAHAEIEAALPPAYRKGPT